MYDIQYMAMNCNKQEWYFGIHIEICLIFSKIRLLQPISFCIYVVINLFQVL